MRYILSGEITTQKIKDIVNNWRSNPQQYNKLKNQWNYYSGNQKILRKRYNDPCKPCNKIVTNFCHQITEQYQGYCVGIPVTYTVDRLIRDFLNYNDVNDKDSLLLRNALIYGKSFELQFIDEDKKNRFEIIDTLNGIDIYDDELQKDELKAFIYFYAKDNYMPWKLSPKYCDVYTVNEIIHYTVSPDFQIFEETGRERHFFNQVPVVVLELNNDIEGIFNQIISLQDAYNTLISSEIDDWEAFVDAYLVLANCSATKEQIQEMKEKRVITLPDNNASAQFLTKQVNDSQIKDLLEAIRDRIYEISDSPNYLDMSFSTSSGVALEWKQQGFNNSVKSIMNRMERALRKRIELFEGIEKIKGTEDFAEVRIEFTPNLPTNSLDIANMIEKYKGLVSTRTLLSQIPFVTDVDRELELLKKEQEESANNNSSLNTEDNSSNLTNEDETRV